MGQLVRLRGGRSRRRDGNVAVDESRRLRYHLHALDGHLD
jgi:hypothetical protein